MTQPTDTFAEIAGIEPGTPVDDLRRTRPDIVEALQATFEAIFEPVDDAALSRIEREAAALHSATLAKAAEIAAFHRSRLIALGAGAERFVAMGASLDTPDLDRRQQAILRHTEILTLHPVAATAEDVEVLLGVGVSPEGVVVLTQLVAFIAFEVRTIAALRAIAGEGTR